MGGDAGPPRRSSLAVAWLEVDGRIVAPVEVARSRAERRRGLLGRTGVRGALMLPRCRSVHTVGMRFALDVVWLDRTGAVVRVARVDPGRVTRPVRRSRAVVEATAGSAADWGLCPGSRVRVCDDAPMSTDGALVLVATPIGNLGDLSPRAVEALRTADVIAAEDTRRTRALCTHAGVPAGGRLLAVHAHNERRSADEIVARVRAGARVAFVTDAGMPGISDPGERLVRVCVEAGVPVEVVPGPSATLTALVLSGFPTDRFVVEGFLPRSGRERTERIAEVVGERRTVVLFESPRRVAATLSDLAAACGGDRPVAVARELTKLHEEVWRGPLADAVARAGATEPRGEHVLVLAPAPPPADVDDDTVRAALVAALAAGASARDAAAEVAAGLGIPRRRAYDLAVALRSGA